MADDWICTREDHLRLEQRVATLEADVARLRSALASGFGVVVDDQGGAPDWGTAADRPGPTGVQDARDDRAGPFLMRIEHVNTITGRGTVVTGRVERGRLNVGERVQIVGTHGKPPIKTTVTAMESPRGQADVVQAGDNVGLLLSAIKRDEVVPGQVVVAPGSAP